MSLITDRKRVENVIAQILGGALTGGDAALQLQLALKPIYGDQLAQMASIAATSGSVVGGLTKPEWLSADPLTAYIDPKLIGGVYVGRSVYQDAGTFVTVPVLPGAKNEPGYTLTQRIKAREEALTPYLTGSLEGLIELATEKRVKDLNKQQKDDVADVKAKAALFGGAGLGLVLLVIVAIGATRRM
jgi:hypothetical protein